MNKNSTADSRPPLKVGRDKFIKEDKECCGYVKTLNCVYWKVILLAVFTLSFIGCEKIFPKTTPSILTIPMPSLEPISVTKDTKETRTAILTGVQDLGWEFKEEAEGQIDVVRRDQTRMAAIRITYDEQVVQFHYLRSSNFDCEPSGVSCSKIHRVYGEWVKRLRSWVEHELELAKIPLELKKETMKQYEPITIRIGNSEPDNNYQQIGPISGVDGKGCGLFGRRGSYEGAVAQLKQEASRLGATYVQIIRLTEPHQTSINCFDNRYQIYAFAFRGKRTSHNVEEKTVSQGTCFSVSPNGLVLTNHHVIENTQKITVHFEDKTKSEAQVAIVSHETDLALLRLKTHHSAYLPLAKPEALQLGQEVFTMGYPAQAILGRTVKYSEGNISALGVEDNQDFLLQISVPVQPGNSGGPFVTDSGEVVGVVTATAAIGTFFKLTGSFPQNVSWAVKAQYAHSIFDQPEALSPTPDRKAAIERVKNAVCRIEAETR